MEFSINNNNSAPFVIGENPNICPHCHVVNEPQILYTRFDNKIDKFISVWKCNYNKCNKIFVVSHKKDGNVYIVERNLNGLPKGPDWPTPILELKSEKLNDDDEPIQSNFIKTYLQSLEAEQYGLDELAGMGYRKAIEYLVKDWAIQNNPAEKDKIEKSWLGEVIKAYYEGDLKDILERATWLGNDQAHYNKLFEEFDIIVLKELIDLIMVELDRQYKKAHYIELIKSKK
ncbi:MAG: DUF4145 domain-containing protein [Bacteroidetes bacterium]|nr:DUF4145 domain-containing protein [Bacteroidota bacterium]